MSVQLCSRMWIPCVRQIYLGQISSHGFAHNPGFSLELWYQEVCRKVTPLPEGQWMKHIRDCVPQKLHHIQIYNDDSAGRFVEVCQMRSVLKCT